MHLQQQESKKVWETLTIEKQKRCQKPVPQKIVKVIKVCKWIEQFQPKKTSVNCIATFEPGKAADCKSFVQTKLKVEKQNFVRFNWKARPLNFHEN